VCSPIETIDAAIAAVDAEVDRCVDCGDAGGYFTIVYRAVTERARAGIVAGEFADCEQMERFDVLFALRYLDACGAPEPTLRTSPRRSALSAPTSGPGSKPAATQRSQRSAPGLHAPADRCAGWSAQHNDASATTCRA
jgi:hypothetical protein